MWRLVSLCGYFLYIPCVVDMGIFCHCCYFLKKTRFIVWLGVVLLCFFLWYSIFFFYCVQRLFFVCMLPGWEKIPLFFVPGNDGVAPGVFRVRPCIATGFGVRRAAVRQRVCAWRSFGSKKTHIVRTDSNRSLGRFYGYSKSKNT